ncbi:pyridoxal phosphate-dependent aminotransferase [Planctomycetota bacterium]
MIEPKKIIRDLNRLRDIGSDRSGYVRLDKNERTVPFTDEMLLEMIASIDAQEITMYPDQTVLYRKLSEFLSIEESYILLTAGSDSAIKTIYETYVNAGDEVIYLWPTYAMIDVYADMFAAKKIKIGYSHDLKVDFCSLLDHVENGARIAFIANPNQPTGTILSKSEINQIVQASEESGTLLVLDEAYLSFSDQKSAMKYVKEYSNVAVVQTFSKAFGLASVRLGYIVTRPENIQWLFKVKTLADINIFAIKYGQYVLDHYSIVEDYIQSVRTSMHLVESELASLGVDCITSHANFMHLRFPDNCDTHLVVTKMKKRGYLMRSTGNGLPATIEGCARITVGPVEQMREFLRELEKVLQENCVYT